MDGFQAYAFGTSGLLATEAIPLLLTPKLIVSMLATDPRRITDLETYLCRTLGLTLTTLSILCLLLTGAVPLATITTTDEEGKKNNPYASPVLIVTTTYHALTAFYLYTQLTYGWNFAFTCGIVASSTLFCLGMWVMMFGGDKGSVSRKTGADRRTGNFPFRNEESAREKKKESRFGTGRRSVGKTKSKSGGELS